VSRQTIEHRQGQLMGQRNADCTVTILKLEGVETFRTITNLSTHLPDGDYKLTVAGETAKSRWRKDKNGWSGLG
jgi:hypothetical protein